MLLFDSREIAQRWIFVVLFSTNDCRIFKKLISCTLKCEKITYHWQSNQKKARVVEKLEATCGI
jgi:hypothetical protein